MVDQKIKARAIHRAKIIKGQLEGLIKAIDQEEYCTGLLEDSRAIQKSLVSLDKLLLENHLRTHVKHQLRTPAEEEKAIKELVNVYTLLNK